MFEPSPKLTQHVLWWNETAGRWQEVSWSGFCRARGLNPEWLSEAEREGPTSLPEVPAGDHRFIVCYVEEDSGIFVNFNAHRYGFGDDGMVTHFHNTMTAEQQAIWNRAYTSKEELDPETDAKFRAIQDQEFKNFRLPETLLRALLTDSPWQIKLDPAYGFWRSWETHGGPVIIGTSMH